MIVGNLNMTIYHVNQRLVNQKRALAIEVESSAPSIYRAWIGIYPLRDFEDSYNVVFFEVKKEYIELDYDISDVEMVNKETFDHVSYSKLENILTKWNANLGDFVLPTFCDYPI